MENNKTSYRKLLIIVVVAIIITMIVVYHLNDKNAKQLGESRLALIKSIGSSENKIEQTLPTNESTFVASLKRVLHVKDRIENRAGYTAFYDKKGKVKVNENDLHCSFDIAWFESPYYIAKSVNNGGGAADFVVSAGANDVTIIEFKLGSNSKLKSNLKHQTKVYELASNTTQSIKVIFYFSDKEQRKVKKILKELDLLDKEYVVTIDARNNRISASNIV